MEKNAFHERTVVSPPREPESKLMCFWMFEGRKIDGHTRKFVQGSEVEIEFVR